MRCTSVLIADGRIQPEALVEMLVQMFLGGVVTDWQRSKMRRLPAQRVSTAP